jgi:hypothetical protein
MNRASTLAALAVIIGVAAVLFLRSRASAGFLPPHEFAYGTALTDLSALPDKVHQFLSLEALDPAKTQVETFVGLSSAKNLTPLIGYLARQKNPAFNPLMTSLADIDKLSDQKDKAVRLVRALASFGAGLKDESKQDSVIVFVYYGLKDPAVLLPTAKNRISDLVRQLDTERQLTEFNGGKCPTNYLVGNVNIYPLAIDNTMWHQHVDFGQSSTSPILEIRFMGLRGIFRYLLGEFQAQHGGTFMHLDGEEL